MNAEILAIGTELLMGQIANTNAQYISMRLADIGINVYYHSVAGDNPVRIRECLGIALGRSDILIVTGGLGPTKDDLTKEIISEFFGLKLVVHQDILAKMQEFFGKLNRPMSNNNIKQAYLPEGCFVVTNSNGTAPGCIIETGSNTIVMLPGPPQEMKSMLDETVLYYLQGKSDKKLFSKYVRIFGVGESMVEQNIMDLIDNQSNPTIAPYAKEGEVTLRITAGAPSAEHAVALVEPVVDEIRRRFGDTVYSTENKDLNMVVVEMLLNGNLTISIAESCTGGSLSSKLTDIPGISQVFDRAFITYSNRSKIENLGVKAKTIEKYGAVSKETAFEMATGVLSVSGSDIGFAITGVAGPGGGTEDKPVGLVYIALADSNGEKEYKELRLWGSRQRIRNVTVLHSLDMIRRYAARRIN